METLLAAELRREITADVQRLRDRIKDKLTKRNTSTLARSGETTASSLLQHVKGSFSKEEVRFPSRHASDGDESPMRRIKSMAFAFFCGLQVAFICEATVQCSLAA
jgi:hypothetical protein